MAFSDIFSILGLNSPAGPSYGQGDAATAATNPLAAVAAPSMSGYNDADVAQARSQTLMSLAPLLLGAGMRQMPSQRAATLAAGAAVLGQMPHNILNAAQTRLLNQREAQSSAAYAQQQEAIKSALARPDLSPAIKELIKADPDKGLSVAAQQSLPTELERTATALNMPINDVFDRQHPAQNQWTYTSDGRGGYLGYNRVTNETKFIRPNGNVNALTGQPESSQAPSQQTTPVAAAPPKVPSNAGDAFGLSMTPVWTGIAGLTGQPTSPDVQKKVTAGAEMQSLNDELTGLLAADLLPGMKSKYTAERITRELPTVHGWFTGPDTAAATYEGKLPQLKDKMQEALQSYNSAVSLGQEGEAAKAANHYRALETAIAKTSEAIKALRANQAGQSYDPSLATSRGLANSNTNQNSQQNNAISTIDKARQLLGR